LPGVTDGRHRSPDLPDVTDGTLGSPDVTDGKYQSTDLSDVTDGR
jgi:hypothetical protein